MKRILALVLVLMVLTGTVYAGSVDLSGMTFDELVALKAQINLAIWNSKEWQEVEVPQGVWKIGEDIPARHWAMKTNADWASITVCTALDETGKEADRKNSSVYYYEFVRCKDSKYFDEKSDLAEMDFDFKVGQYVIIDNGSLFFTPYAGKPDLGFK